MNPSRDDVMLFSESAAKRSLKQLCSKASVSPEKKTHGLKSREQGGFSLPFYILIQKIMDKKSIPKKPEIPKDIRGFRIEWQGITIYLKWEPEAYWGVIAYLEIQSENRVRIPITETGYRSHSCHKADIEAYGGPVEFVRNRLEEKSQSPEWKSYLKTKDSQSLF